MDNKLTMLRYVEYCAYKKEECDERDFAKASRREVIRMRDDITAYI